LVKTEWQEIRGTVENQYRGRAERGGEKQVPPLRSPDFLLRLVTLANFLLVAGESPREGFAVSHISRKMSEMWGTRVLLGWIEKAGPLLFAPVGACDFLIFFANERGPRTAPDFLYAALDISACAAFFTESRMRLILSTNPNRKSGYVLGNSQPSLRDYSDRFLCSRGDS